MGSGALYPVAVAPKEFAEGHIDTVPVLMHAGRLLSIGFENLLLLDAESLMLFAAAPRLQKHELTTRKTRSDAHGMTGDPDQGLATISGEC